MTLGILGGGASNKKLARPLSHGRGFGLGHLAGALGAFEFCPSPCKATPDANVKRYQSMMNTDLKRMNYNQVGVDGRVGKATCGLDMFFSQVPQLFNTARSSWDDPLTYQISQACKGKPFALPSPVSKKDSVFVADADDPVCKKESPAWATVSDKIAGNSRQLNVQLNDLGYEDIPVSGELNATFCGAAKLVDALNNTSYLCNPGFNCKSFITPSKKVTAPVQVVQPVAIATPAPPMATKPKTTQASMATTGLLVGAAAAGVYFLGKHYHWFG